MTTFTALTTVPGQALAEALGEALEALEIAPTGIGVFEIEDGSGMWEVGAFFDTRPDELALDLLAAVHGGRPFSVSRLDDRDWVAQVRRELSPIRVGRFVVHGGHDAEAVGPQDIGLRIEAAMAFGTGHHGSTQGCLALFDRLCRLGFRPRRVADLGTGTGVLAMAAARALRIPGVAGDLDPIAVATARENLAANGAGGFVRTVEAPGLRSPLFRSRAPYDLIFANILARPLMRLAPEIAAALSHPGVAILSGLLEAQAPGVAAVYRGHGLAVVMRHRIGGWASLAVARRDPRRARR